MYVNGVQVGTRAQTGTLRRAPSRCASAATPCGRSGSAGALDEIRVYDRALTAAQIQADMAKAVSSPTLLRTAGKAGAKRPVAKTKRSAGAKVKRYRGRFTHYGKWLGPRRTYDLYLAGRRPKVRLCAGPCCLPLCWSRSAAGRRTPRRSRRASARRRCGPGSATRPWCASRPTVACSSPPRPAWSTRSTASTTRRRRSSPTSAPRSRTSGTAGCSGWRSRPTAACSSPTRTTPGSGTPARAAGPRRPAARSTRGSRGWTRPATRPC